jgi:hypothetical protein
MFAINALKNFHTLSININGYELHEFDTYCLQYSSAFRKNNFKPIKLTLRILITIRVIRPNSCYY